jgi:hypothetical protein
MSRFLSLCEAIGAHPDHMLKHVTPEAADALVAAALAGGTLDAVKAAAAGRLVGNPYNPRMRLADHQQLGELLTLVRRARQELYWLDAEIAQLQARRARLAAALTIEPTSSEATPIHEERHP